MNKDKKTRFLMVLGFVAVVVILAWLAVQVVRYAPVAFSALADIFNANQTAMRDEFENDDEINLEDDETVEPDTTSEEEVVEEEVEEEVASDEVEEEVEVDTSTTDDTYTPPPVQYRTVTTYKIPESDPNGYTDLQVTFLAIGHLNSSEKFVPTNYLDRNSRSAMQFVVKNIGTKTSTAWSFSAELPDGGTMSSMIQQPLKPAESATITIVFSTGSKRDNENIGVTATGGNDNIPSNNGFRKTIEVR